MDSVGKGQHPILNKILELIFYFVKRDFLLVIIRKVCWKKAEKDKGGKTVVISL